MEKRIVATIDIKYLGNIYYQKKKKNFYIWSLESTFQYISITISNISVCKFKEFSNSPMN